MFESIFFLICRLGWQAGRLRYVSALSLRQIKKKMLWMDAVQMWRTSSRPV